MYNSIVKEIFQISWCHVAPNSNFNQMSFNWPEEPRTPKSFSYFQAPIACNTMFEYQYEKRKYGELQS